MNKSTEEIQTHDSMGHFKEVLLEDFVSNYKPIDSRITTLFEIFRKSSLKLKRESQSSSFIGFKHVDQCFLITGGFVRDLVKLNKLTLI